MATKSKGKVKFDKGKSPRSPDIKAGIPIKNQLIKPTKKSESESAINLDELIALSPENVLQGVLWSEILRRPISSRKGRW
jgi:hypothetical protein